MPDIISRSFPGFKFRPTEEELISYYLHRKVRGGLTPEENDSIKDCNLYGEGAHPSCDIFKKFTGHKGGGHAFYFFTTLIKKTPNSTQWCRTDGEGGTWHGENRSDEVKSRPDQHGVVIGWRKRFSYKNEKRPDQHGCWTLLEYSTPESISENVVVCKLTESRKRKRMDPVEKPAHHQEPRPLIQNQEMLPLVGTVSNEDNGGFSATGDTFHSIIHNMGLEAPAMGNIEPVLPIQPQQANFIQESMLPFEESIITENQQMEPASYNGGEGACPAGDNAVTPEAAAPAVSAYPTLDAGLIEDMKNQPNWSANFEHYQI